MIKRPLERARIFISCGQNKNTDEAALAGKIRTAVRKRGFDPYVAVDVQTLQGLKESIFARLENSEYFIFVDFKRAKLSDDPLEYRGSLFSHQELALASCLEIEVLAFQEEGIKKSDGIIAFLQTNPHPFGDRSMLPDFIAAKLQERRWDPRWRNQLILERDLKQFTDPYHLGLKKMTRYFNIRVKNLHRDKVARNCYVYLEKVIRPDRTEIHPKTLEIKWAGSTLPNAQIAPGTAREFDAFFIISDLPEIWNISTIFTDAAYYVVPQFEGKGIYELQYVVYSDNFPTARGTFKLDLNSSPDLTTLE